MKIFSLLFIINSWIYAQPYTFLVNKYDKELELESKIILSISKSLIMNKDDILLFIPNITKIEEKVYKRKFTLVNSCKESNFIFVKRHIKNEELCSNENKIYFTNNYKKLLSNDNYYGAFFWSKNRPNIVFIKRKLEEKNIKLPSSYTQFIEDI